MDATSVTGPISVITFNLHSTSFSFFLLDGGVSPSGCDWRNFAEVLKNWHLISFL